MRRPSLFPDGGSLRILRSGDRAEVVAFLERSVPENIYLLSRIARVGIDRRRLGSLLGYRRDGELTAVCLNAGGLFVTGADPSALPVFARELGPWRKCSSMLGPTFASMGLFLGLSGRWPSGWGDVSNVRRRQPVMLLDGPPAVAPDNRVRKLVADDYPSYLQASVEMYTDEIGTSPFAYGRGYEHSVMQRLRDGDAYGIVENGKVIFKADLGPKYGDQAQLQGVWLAKELRGRGLAAPMLAGMLVLAQRRYPQISLYVNDFNTAAVRAYERLGFRHVGMLSTIHY